MVDSFDNLCDMWIHIKAVGIGKTGLGAISRIAALSLRNISFVAVDSNISILGNSPAQEKIHVRCKLSEDSPFSAKVAEAVQQTLSNYEAISNSLHSEDLIFIIANLGDAIGCGVVPALASLTKQWDALVIAFVIVPFDIFDNVLKTSLEYIEKSVDTVVLLSEDCIMESVREIMPGMTELEIQMEVLKQGVQAITLMITELGAISIDYADMLDIMRHSGKAFMSLGSAEGEDRSEKAVEHAISQPLLGRSRLAKASNASSTSMAARIFS